MKSLKIFVFAILFISITSEILAGDFYFTYTGPTTPVIPYGSSTVNATYYFTYYYPENITLIRPRLTIEFDGNTIAGAICLGNDSYLPSGYTFNLTPGSHTIKLTLSDLGQQSNDCTEATIWQIEEFTVTAYFKVRNENIFGGGTIYVDNYTTQKTSPYDRTAYANFNYAIGAIDQDYSGYQWIWNASGINNSKWQKKLYNEINLSDVSNNRNTTYNVQSNDISTKLIAGLRKNYLINQINQTEFDNNQTETSYIVEQNSGTISTQGTGYTPGAISYNFAGWLDNSTMSSTRTITPTDNSTYTALYKYPNHSNSINAISSNSQRKILSTTDGRLHKVYESMNKIWYEVSTDNGATWTVQNNGKPLSSNEAKSPAIDYYGNCYIFIVWQEKIEETFKIKLAYISYPSTVFIISDAYDESWNPAPLSYTFNTTPVVAWENNRILVAWRDLSGLYYKYGTLDCYGPLTWYTSFPSAFVSGTDANSSNPTLCIRKDGGTTVFHLGWQQSTTAIKYCTLTPNTLNIITQSTVETPSTGDAVNYKKNPSISIKSDGYPTLVWIGSIYEGATTQVTRRTRYSSGWATTFNKYGANVESPTEYNSIVTWSENSVNKLYRPWSSVRTLSTVGKSVQLTNNISGSEYAVAYRQTSPYDFQTSVNVISLAKENSIINKCGREGVAKKGDAEFYFILGDVMAGSDVIQFVDIPDTSTLLSTNDLNQYMETNSFQINSTSNFYLSLAYGSPDTVKALNELQGNYSLNYKVELVDAVTNVIIGILKEVATNENDISIGEIISYEVNTQSIGERVVKLRVSTNTNFSGTYYLADIISEEEVLGKGNFEKIDLANTVVTDYDLFQNYPNPFNPSTKISWQSPVGSMQTIKVYDILGKEVATLVDEFREAGVYEIIFDASKLASGVYVYKLQAGDFISSKKMMLLK